MSGALSLLPPYMPSWPGQVKRYLSACNSLGPSGVKTQGDFCKSISRKEIRRIRWTLWLFLQVLGFSR